MVIQGIEIIKKIIKEIIQIKIKIIIVVGLHTGVNLSITPTKEQVLRLT